MGQGTTARLAGDIQAHPGGLQNILDSSTSCRTVCMEMAPSTMRYQARGRRASHPIQPSALHSILLPPWATSVSLQRGVCTPCDNQQCDRRCRSLSSAPFSLLLASNSDLIIARRRDISPSSRLAGRDNFEDQGPTVCKLWS
jgi:hypothetical protein